MSTPSKEAVELADWICSGSDEWANYKESLRGRIQSALDAAALVERQRCLGIVASESDGLSPLGLTRSILNIVKGRIENPEASNG